jgi:hypothetical protein
LMLYFFSRHSHDGCLKRMLQERLMKEEKKKRRGLLFQFRVLFPGTSPFRTLLYTHCKGTAGIIPKEYINSLRIDIQPVRV